MVRVSAEPPSLPAPWDAVAVSVTWLLVGVVRVTTRVVRRGDQVRTGQRYRLNLCPGAVESNPGPF
jgi:hypothetical protein